MDLNYLKPLLEKKCEELGYDLVNLSSKKEKGDLTLSLVVDRPSPIDMNEIVRVSEVISSYFDEIDDGEEKYTLDISSLGAEKPIRVDKLHLYVGNYVHVHLNNPIDGENIYEGDLESVNEDSFILSIRIKTRVKKLVILFNNIYKIRLAIKF